MATCAVGIKCGAAPNGPQTWSTSFSVRVTGHIRTGSVVIARGQTIGCTRTALAVFRAVGGKGSNLRIGGSQFPKDAALHMGRISNDRMAEVTVTTFR